MIVSVFKTSIEDQHLEKVATILNNINRITKWNTDLEDCDNILRIESNENLTKGIIKKLVQDGFKIEELQD